jgi:hypothetical protein
VQDVVRFCFTPDDAQHKVIGIPAVVQASEGGVVGIAGWIVRPEFFLVENFLFPLPGRGVVALLERCVHPFPEATAAGTDGVIGREVFPLRPSCECAHHLLHK